jgi:hypothetical protein
MERQWYLARDGKVFGPVTDAQLAEAVAGGRVLPTDQLNVAGHPDWRLATDVPGLLPAAPEPVPAPTPETETETEAIVAELDTAVEAVELAPADAVEIAPVDLEPVAPVKLRVTCLACFREVSVEVMPGSCEAHCPKCRSSIELEKPVEDPKQSANQAAFAKLESKREFHERMQKKEASARSAAKRDGAVVGGVLGAIISGNG